MRTLRIYGVSLVLLLAVIRPGELIDGREEGWRFGAYFFVVVLIRSGLRGLVLAFGLLVM